MMADEPLTFLLINLHRSSFQVRLPPGKRPVDQHQNRMGDRNQCALLTPSGESPESIFQKTIFLFGSGPRTFDKDSPQPAISTWNLRWLGFAPCAVVSGTDSSPGTQVRLGRELRHIGADLSQNARC